MKDPLSAALMFAAFLLYVRAARAEEARAWLLATAAGLLLFWCASLAKASALVLPALMLLYALALAPDRRRALKLLVPFAVLALALAVVAFETGRASGAVKVRTASAGRVALATVTVVGTYLRRLALPTGLSPRYPSGGNVAVASLLVVAWALVLAASAIRRRRLWFALGWLGAALLPYLNLVRTSTQQADRYLYVAVGGFAMCLGLGAEAVVGGRWSVVGVWKRRIAVAIGVVAIGAYGAMSVRQSRFWRSSERLWERALACAPDDPLAHYLLGEAIWQTEPERAASHFLRAANAHLEITADRFLAALTALREGDRTLAARHSALAAQHERLAADALAYLGTALRQAGDLEGALHAHREAMRRDQAEARHHYLVASDLVALDRVTEAIGHYERAARGPDWLAREVVAELRQLEHELRSQGHTDDARAVADLLRRLPASPHGR